MNEDEHEIDSEESDIIDFGYECDLHHFHPRATKNVVNEFIKQAVEKNLSPIRLVHGKGKSVKKEHIHKILTEHQDVLNFKDDGYNWGATIISLKSK